MNLSSHRPFSTALVSLLFAVAGCGSHDSSVGTSQLASDELRGRGGSGGGACDSAKAPGSGVGIDCNTASVTFKASNIECNDLLAKCSQAAKSDPSANLACLFNGAPIFEYETKAGICDPYVGGGGGSAGSGGSSGGGDGVGCGFAKAPGFGAAVECSSGGLLFKASSIDCEGMLAKCQSVGDGDPMLSFTCTFDGITIFEQEAKAGICDGVSGGGGSAGSGGGGGGCGFAQGPGVGVAVDCSNSGVIIKAGGIECDDMLAKCASVAKSDPSLNINCTFDGVTIFEQEAKAGVCDGFGGGSAGGGGAGGASGACPLGQIDVPACAAGQAPTTSCDAARCVDFEQYLGAVDDCPSPDAVVLDCYDFGAPTEYCSLECR
jgi:hypothetical protein